MPEPSHTPFAQAIEQLSLDPEQRARVLKLVERVAREEVIETILHSLEPADYLALDQQLQSGADEQTVMGFLMERIPDLMTRVDERVQQFKRELAEAMSNPRRELANPRLQAILAALEEIRSA